MKIAISTLGTRGDLQPFLALGLGLRQAGHEVLVISSKNEEGLVKSYGLHFFALSVDIQKLMESDEVQEMSKGNNPLKFIISHLKGSQKLRKSMVATQAEIWAGCQDADLILFHPGMPVGFFIAKQLGIPSVLASPFPVIKTADYPSILFYTAPPLGLLFNKLTHWIFQKLFWSLTKSAIVEFWKKDIGSNMDFSMSPIGQQVKSGMPVINGYSELFFHQPKDWPANVHTTGNWLIPADPTFVPAPDLSDFIDHKPEPLYIGFGSMKDVTTFENKFEIILKALEITSQRAVIALGWSNLTYPGPIPDHVFLVESIPHTWLFSRVSMVIHHGGAGTTAAGLTAGKPTVIIPHNADQPAWGQKVYELGVGAKPIKKTKLTAANLASAIAYAQQPRIIENARRLGIQLRLEDGVGNAVKIIDAYLAQK